jgi:hypothetical protein
VKGGQIKQFRFKLKRLVVDKNIPTMVVHPNLDYT